MTMSKSLWLKLWHLLTIESLIVFSVIMSTGACRLCLHTLFLHIVVAPFRTECGHCFFDSDLCPALDSTPGLQE